VKKTMTRKRYYLLGLLLATPIFFFQSIALAASATAVVPFAFADVENQARQMAQQMYVFPEKVPDILTKLTYDEWRSIRLKQDKVLWVTDKTPFQLQFFHPGLFYDRTVDINIIESGKVVPLAGQRDWYEYGGLEQAPQFPDNIGIAGFRLHMPIKSPKYFDEFLVFLGASYLRAVGKENTYGLSARGLALDTAGSEGEEFPWFREFWIVKPQPKDKSLTLYALLDSPRVTGAFQYRVIPGVETVLEVTSKLFFRADIDKVGIAPLTSMYFYGENNREPGVRDFRPEVHDSDGLQIQFGSGEWHWRPLNNPRLLQLNSFKAQGIKGFGLMQRDLKFESYEDLEAIYHQRPSLWIEPLSDWGGGHVELVQIPTRSEVHDNIVAFWVPQIPAKAGDTWQFDYRMRWGDATMVLPPGAHVLATRIGDVDNSQARRFVIDFDGDQLRKLPDTTTLDAVVTASAGGRIENVNIQKNPYNLSWRLFFEVVLEPVTTMEKMLPDKGQTIELRAFLKQGADVLSETWSYSLNRKIR
jgi:periplasmic glucans biosynthesis protein